MLTAEVLEQFKPRLAAMGLAFGHYVEVGEFHSVVVRCLSAEHPYFPISPNMLTTNQIDEWIDIMARGKGSWAGGDSGLGGTAE